ncbi:MAG: EFR1 family ferrodoxin [Lachnospiraceae bacterium]|nr:EFR1 family ferrodoxin [Lachnospiraceae bacterium]
MIGLFLSGTGNTKHCTELFLHAWDERACAVPIESPDAAKLAAAQDVILLAYPTQFSNIPYMIRDFIHKNAALWPGKHVFCLNTMGLFSGDGTGCAARLLKKYGAHILGGLQIPMPDSVCDSKLLKKSEDKNLELIQMANQKLLAAAAQIKRGAFPQEGLGLLDHMAGLFGQRLWFYSKTRGYCNRLKISDACIGCGLCANRCPMHNLILEQGKAKAGDRCTMCYRCISSCPRQAITLLGKEIVEQYRFERFEQFERPHLSIDKHPKNTIH